jgi:uncharacterized protein YodC (DUF2158 family)
MTETQLSETIAPAKVDENYCAVCYQRDREFKFLQYRIGYCVQLKSGGPDMVVAELNIEKRIVKCLWFDKTGVQHEQDFPVDAIENKWHTTADTIKSASESIKRSASEILSALMNADIETA